jgi:hypothetical protein
MLVRRCAAVASTPAALAACGSDSAAPTEQALGTNEVITEPTLPKNPPPEELQATWFRADATSAEPERMYLRGTSYTISRGAADHGTYERRS